MGKPIRVWRFDRAPARYQALSDHGGDEDWLAFVPYEYYNAYIPWLESPQFGCCRISEHPVRGGTVWIGAHA